MDDTKKTVDLYENKNQLLNAAIDKIVVEIFNKRVEGSKAQKILLTGCSPVAGTTSVCISLAIALANTKRKVLLVDCDVRKTLKYKKLNEELDNGLADYLLQDEHNGKALEIENVIYLSNIRNLDYIPCGSTTGNPTRILCSESMENLIERVSEDYDCIIFDLPSLNIVPDAQILFKNMDGIALIAALGETRKRQIKEAKMKIAPFADKYYGMIINKIPLDMYKFNVQNYDYYFLDKKGEQKLNGSVAHKKYDNKIKRGRK